MPSKKDKSRRGAGQVGRLGIGKGDDDDEEEEDGEEEARWEKGTTRDSRPCHLAFGEEKEEEDGESGCCDWGEGEKVARVGDDIGEKDSWLGFFLRFSP